MDYVVTVAPEAGEVPDPNLVVVNVYAIDQANRPNIAAGGRPAMTVARIAMRPTKE